MSQQIKNALTNSEINILLDYLKIDDHRTDQRPDVRSKHPRWGIDQWPENIIKKVLDKITTRKYIVEDITFHDSKIALKTHTDYGSLAETIGMTCLFTLHAEPVAHTIYFKNKFLMNSNPTTGVVFTRTPWTPYSYSLENKYGKIINVSDLRELLAQCISDPNAVTDFVVDDKFIDLLKSTIHKRSLPYVNKENQDKQTGYQQPAPRSNDYESLTDFNFSENFDHSFHQKMLSHIPYEDLQGLTVENVFEWEPGSIILHQRNQLHCSSSCHNRKIFLTVFYHEV